MQYQAKTVTVDCWLGWFQDAVALVFKAPILAAVVLTLVWCLEYAMPWPSIDALLAVPFSLFALAAFRSIDRGEPLTTHLKNAAQTLKQRPPTTIVSFTLLGVACNLPFELSHFALAGGFTALNFAAVGQSAPLWLFAGRDAELPLVWDCISRSPHLVAGSFFFFTTIALAAYQLPFLSAPLYLIGVAIIYSAFTDIFENRPRKRLSKTTTNKSFSKEANAAVFLQL